MTVPAVLLAIGVLCWVLALVLLRRVGPGYRIARILSAAPVVPLAEARRIAQEGPPGYVRVQGRVSSDEEFPDENNRPLVFRRRRVEVQDPPGTPWRLVEDERLAVPFGLEDRHDHLAIDVSALADGLVVIPRVGSGRAADVETGRLPHGLPPETAVRLRLDQVSAVEHATAAGVPRLGAEGEPLLGEGMGRPLVLTTLDLPEAMRLLSGGHRRELVLATALFLAGGAALAGSAAVWLAAL